MESRIRWERSNNQPSMTHTPMRREKMHCMHFKYFIYQIIDFSPLLSNSLHAFAIKELSWSAVLWCPLFSSWHILQFCGRLSRDLQVCPENLTKHMWAYSSKWVQRTFGYGPQRHFSSCCFWHRFWSELCLSSLHEESSENIVKQASSLPQLTTQYHIDGAGIGLLLFFVLLTFCP